MAHYFQSFITARSVFNAYNTIHSKVLQFKSKTKGSKMRSKPCAMFTNHFQIFTMSAKFCKKNR